MPIDNNETDTAMYHVVKALSGSVQFRSSVNGAQCRLLKKAVLLKCLKARNDIYEWVFTLILNRVMVTYARQVH